MMEKMKSSFYKLLLIYFLGEHYIDKIIIKFENNYFQEKRV